MSAWIQLLFARLVPHLGLVSVKEGKSDKVAEKAISIISQRYNEVLTLEKTAKLIGVSRSYLSRVIMKKSEKSFSQLLNFTRVDKARHLLIKTQLSVTEVAYESGFSSIRSFNRNFFDICGISPREYRRNSDLV